MEHTHLNFESYKAPHNLHRPFQRPDHLADPLYVITPVFNARRFRARWKHYRDFEKYIHESGAILYTVEVAFGDREFVVTTPDNPRHIQLRTDHELWLKERSINLAAMRLPPTWKYLAWIDADCTFARFDWANETLHALQHYPVVQMWSQLLDLNPDSELAGPPLDSFGKIFCGGGVPRPYTSKQTFGCPGLAWAADRSAWDQLGGLFDYTILGAGDWYFAACVSGTVDKMIQQRNDFTPAFRRHLDEYYARVEDSSWKGRSIKGNVGCVLGAALHRWHGHKKLRQYATRGRILRAHNFDPGTDLKPDWQGLYQLTNRKPQLRRDIAKYFMARNEDSE